MEDIALISYNSYIIKRQFSEMKMKKLLNPLLWVLVLVISILLVVMFSLGGCRPAVSPVEEPVVEEVTGEPEK